MIWTGKRYAYAHRVVFESAHGPIPAGMQLDHLCRQRSCCNPDHLQVVTCAENLRRGRSTRLTSEDAEFARLTAGRLTGAAVAAVLGVTADHVYAIRRGKAWGPAGAAALARRRPSRVGSVT